MSNKTKNSVTGSNATTWMDVWQCNTMDRKIHFTKIIVLVVRDNIKWIESKGSSWALIAAN